MRKAALDYDWDNNLNDNPNEMVNHFYEILFSIAKNFIPNKTNVFNAK